MMVYTSIDLDTDFSEALYNDLVSNTEPKFEPYSIIEDDRILDCDADGKVINITYITNKNSIFTKLKNLFI